MRARAIAITAAVIAAAGLLLGAPGAARAQEAGEDEAAAPGSTGGGAGQVRLVEVHGASSLGALVRPGRWFTVNVVIANTTDEDRTAVLRVFPFDTGVAASAAPAEGVSFNREVQVPRRSRRSETIAVRVDVMHPLLAVALEPDEGDPSYQTVQLAEAVQTSIRGGPNDTRGRGIALLAIGEGAGALRQALGLEGPPSPLGPLHLVLHEANADGLSADPASFDPFDVVAVVNPDPKVLDAPRQRALLDWVARGGHLIVSFSGQVGEFAQEPLREALPMQPARQVELELDPGRLALDRPGKLTPDYDMTDEDPAPIEGVPRRPGRPVPLVTAAGALSADARVLLRATPDRDGAPLAMRRRHGAGIITYLAYDVSKSPISGNLINRGYARLLLGSDYGTGGRSERDALVDLAQEVLIALPQLRPPHALLVGMVLLVYLALVGPAGYVILRRMGRREWIVATGPALAVAFAFIFYTLGILHRGTSAISTRFVIMDALAADAEAGASAAAGPSGRIDTHIGYFVPSKGRYSGASASVDPASGEHLHLAPVGPSTGAVGPRTTTAVVREDAPVYRLEDVQVEASTGRLFLESRTMREAPLAASVELMPDGGVRGRFTTGEWPLSDVYLVLGDRHVFVASQIGANEEEELSVGAGGLQPGMIPDRFFRALLAERGRRDEYQTWAGASFDDDADRLRDELRRRLTSAAARPDVVSATLIAFTKPTEKDGDLQLESAASSRAEKGIAFIEIPVRVPAKGEFRIARGHVPRRLAAASEGFSIATPAMGNPFPALDPGASVLYEFQLPVCPERGDQIEQLEVHIQVDKQNGTTTVSLFDFATGQLEERVVETSVPFRLGGASAARYVHPTLGIVWVRVHQRPEKDPSLIDWRDYSMRLRSLDVEVAGKR